MKTLLNIMNIAGFIAIALMILALTAYLIAFLWNVKEMGLLFNIFRYSITASFIIGSVWSLLFIYLYDELK
jgi:hypothetical protein